MIDSWLNTLGTLISESVWLAPLLALLAGVLTSFTPCSLSSIPLVIGYVGGTGTEPKKAFRLSLVFAAGSAITFTILGTLASLAGRLIGTSASWWYLILGILMVLMALQTWEIFNFIPSTYLLSKNTRRGYAGALIAGILGGIFSSPCAGAGRFAGNRGGKGECSIFAAALFHAKPKHGTVRRADMRERLGDGVHPAHRPRHP